MNVKLLPRHRLLLGIAILLILCAGVARPVISMRAEPALPIDALRVPLLRQAAPYSCGATALQAILAYWGRFDGGESRLYGPLECTEKDGTEPPSIVRVASQHGLEASLRERQKIDDLRNGLALGYTIIVDLQAWRDPKASPDWRTAWEDGHYVVLVGLDKHFAYAMDPSTLGAYTFLPLDELSERWHDYESRRGVRKEYHQLAIFIRGTAPNPPGKLVRLE